MNEREMIEAPATIRDVENVIIVLQQVFDGQPSDVMMLATAAALDIMIDLQGSDHAEKVLAHRQELAREALSSLIKGWGHAI